MQMTVFISFVGNEWMILQNITHATYQQKAILKSDDAWKKISKKRQSKIETRKCPKYKNIYFQNPKRFLQK